MNRRRFGSLRRLPSGRWQAIYTAPDGTRVKAPRTFAEEPDAEAWLVDRRREIDRGLWNPQLTTAVNNSFGVYAQRWLERRDLRPRTRETYQRILTSHLVPAFGHLQLAAITPTMIRNWHSTLLPGRPAARSHAYALLKVIMNTAVADELIDASPCRIRGAGTTARVKKIRPASVAELAALEAAMPERFKLTVPLASWCALRFGELIELRRKDIDLDAEVIRVRRAASKIVGAPGGHVVGAPKSAAGIRDVTIPPHCVAGVRLHLAEHVGPHQDSLLFPSTPGGEHHLWLPTMWRYFDRARNSAGRPDLRFHDLRHTGLTMAAATGATLAELMARAGHSTVGAALKYQHAAQSRDAEIATLLSKLADT